ncbi:MAG: hypothetical protein LH631_04815 [Alkalinema sp. CAN_BIN05]|nr:hypothetical protein [Alkalinema sp. CAN_BIN05]
MSTSPDLNSNTSETPLGGYLIEAGLITPAQVSVVLNDQQMETNMLFGEVLVARGWMKLETIEFIMTRVVEPERRATHDRNLAGSLAESLAESQKQTQASQAQKIPPYSVKHFADRSTETLTAPPAQTPKPTPPPYPTTPPVIARARSLDGDFEVEIFDSLADTGSLSGASSGASKTNARRNDRKSLPSVSEDGGVNWAG